MQRSCSLLGIHISSPTCCDIVFCTVAYVYSRERDGKPISKAVVVPIPIFHLIVFAFLPFLLLCQPRVRHGIKSLCCCSNIVGHARHEITHEQVHGTIQQTSADALTSQTHFIVLPETSFTEEAPLIIRQ